MKKYLILLLAITSMIFFFSSCSEDDDPVVEKKPEVEEKADDITGFYFVNYGGSTVGSSTITKYDYTKDSVTNNFYEAQNNVELTSNVQYGHEYQNNVFLMGNDPDQLIILDSAFVQSEIGISEGIATPRFCIGEGDYLYISCLGETPDWKVMDDSYIAKYNIKTQEVESQISTPGGSEGLAISNGNLYVALNYKDSIAVIDLNSEALSYIETPAVSSYFIKDNNDNLYVSFVSTHKSPSDQTGLGYINTQTNTLEATYKLEGVSSGYSEILTTNDDISVIYILAASWGEPATIYSFDTSSKEFTPFIDNLNGINGMSYNDDKDEIYVFGAESYTEPGTVAIYSTEGEKTGEFDCGISPYWGIKLSYDE